MISTPSIRRAWIIQSVLLISIAMLIAGACSTSDRSPTQYVEDPAANAAWTDESGLETSMGGNHRAKDFFPLAIGNRWTYSGAFMMRLEGDSITAVDQYGEVREHTGFEVLFGRDYMVETQKRWSTVIPFPPLDSTTYWIRYRQDKAGLYEADYLITTPPGSGVDSLAPVRSTDRIDEDDLESRQRRFGARLAAAGGDQYQTALTRLGDKVRAAQAAIRTTGMKRRPRHIGGPPGGVLGDEITRLKYPLHPGQHWVIRDEPEFFESYVDGYRIFNLPAGRMGGWVIRINIEGFDERDRVELWYGRNGFLGMRMHVESVATDEFGNPIGVLIADEKMWLEDFNLVQRSP